MRQRETNCRIDDQDRRDKVDMTCTWIFEKGYKTNGDPVERVLATESLVPTRVSI